MEPTETALSHDRFLASLRAEMTLGDLRKVSAGIPYRRYYQWAHPIRNADGSWGVLIKWAQFTYYFREDNSVRTIIVRVDSTSRGCVYYFSSSDDPKPEDWSPKQDGSDLIQQHPSFFMLDQKPTHIGGTERVYDQ